MKLSQIFVSLVFVSGIFTTASLKEDDKRPGNALAKVKGLITNLMDQNRKEKTRELEQNDEYKNWCGDSNSTAEADLLRAIAENETAYGLIMEALANIDETQKEIDALANMIAEKSRELKEANDTAVKELEDFEYSEGVLSEAIENLDQAITILETEYYKRPGQPACTCAGIAAAASFLQMDSKNMAKFSEMDNKQMTKLLNLFKVVTDAVSLNVQGKSKLTALIQSSTQASDLVYHSVSEIPIYQSSSCTVICTLKSMKDTAEEDLKTLRLNEITRKGDHLALVDRLTKEIEDLMADKLEKEEEKDKYLKDLGDAQARALKAEADIVHLLNLLKELKEDCAAWGQNHRQFSKDQDQEYAALKEALFQVEKAMGHVKDGVVGVDGMSSGAYSVGGDAESSCMRQCGNIGHMNLNPEHGSDQMLSCSQTCMMRSRGTSEEECSALCNRSPSSGCALNVNGFAYDMCQERAEYSEKGLNLLTSNQACNDGCSMEPQVSTGGADGAVCTTQDDCQSGKGLFCAVECFNGNGCEQHDRRQQYCQPCQECTVGTLSASGNCDMCAGGGDVTKMDNCTLGSVYAAMQDLSGDCQNQLQTVLDTVSENPEAGHQVQIGSQICSCLGELSPDTAAQFNNCKMYTEAPASLHQFYLACKADDAKKPDWFSFLQTKQTAQIESQVESPLRRARRLAERKVVDILKSLGRANHAAALMQLASRVRVLMKSRNGKEDEFLKVKSMIRDMITKLEAELVKVKEENAYCVENMRKTRNQLSKLDVDIQKLDHEIEYAYSREYDLNDKKGDTQEQMAKDQKANNLLNQMWNEETRIHILTVNELKDGLKAVTMGIQILTEFYGAPAGSAFAQTTLPKATDAIVTMLAQTSSNSTDNSTGGAPKVTAGRGIIGMLQIVEADLARGLAEEEEAWKKDKANFEKENEEFRITFAGENKDVVFYGSEYLSAHRYTGDLTADEKAKRMMQKDVIVTYMNLKKQCDAKPGLYKDKKEAREREIEGLKKAKHILENPEEYELAQVKAVKRSRTGLRGLRRLALQAN